MIRWLKNGCGMKSKDSILQFPYVGCVMFQMLCLLKWKGLFICTFGGTISKVSRSIYTFLGLREGYKK